MIEFMPFPDFCGPRNVIRSWRFHVLFLDWTFHTHELSVRSAIGRLDSPACSMGFEEMYSCQSGPLVTERRCLSCIGISMINLRRSDDCLIFIMEIPTPIRRGLLSE